MKEINVHKLNKDFESRVRLGIMSILIVNDWVNFNDMKELLDITDGNLASHINSLEKNKYIEIRKAFVGKKPETSYRITPFGKSEFKMHIKVLSDLIK